MALSAKEKRDHYCRLLRRCAQEYEDSAEACDTPALEGFRVDRRATATALRALEHVLAEVPASVTALLDQAGAACDALRRTSSDGFTDEQRRAWSVAFSAIRALADYIEERSAQPARLPGVHS